MPAAWAAARAFSASASSSASSLLAWAIALVGTSARAAQPSSWARAVPSSATLESPSGSRSALS